VLRKVVRPELKDVRGGWRKMFKEELHDLYSSSNIVRG
jgi:hypothetical protein